jgi:small nuclear ribonucleoprotein (snRNP)-like protein
MSEDRNYNMTGSHHLYDHCKKFTYFHVIINMNDGSSMEGILEGVDQDRISVLVPEEVLEREDENDDRQYGGYGYGHRPRRRFRRFIRRFLPFALLASLTPYPYAPYPYYPYY